MKSYINLPSVLGRLTYMKSNFCLFALFLMLCSLTSFSQVNYTFTPCGKTGQTGPSQLQVNTAYSTTNLNGSVTVIGNGVQQWTVPATGMYGIRSIGASGGSPISGCITPGGKGAYIYGEFNLTVGQVIKILVGQAGSPSTSSEDGGGGGGSYVTTSASVAMVVAGGGGGGTSNLGGCVGTQRNGLNASITTTATNGANGMGAGGVNGTGGTGTGGGAGGGFTTNGTGGSTTGFGLAFMNGGGGGNYGTAGLGGFGGGGAGFWEGGNGGGGGGYSGGGTNSTNPYAGGGGGGSFNSGTNQTNTIVTTTGDGVVVITKLCSIAVNGTGVNANSAICAGNSVTLTTNAISNYSWSTGATSSSIVVSPTITTIYTLGATSPSLCYTTQTFTINVNSAIPTLTVTNTANSGGICPNSTVNLTASGATTYTWTGGTTSVTNGIPFSPTLAASYLVTGGNACGTTTAAASVSVHPFPTVNPVTSTSTLCAGGSVTLTAIGNATNYVWSGGITNGVGFTPPLTATYTVIGTSALSCTASATIPVTVYATPVNPPTSNPSIVCIGGSSTLSATGALSYTWSSTTQTVNTANFIVTPGLGITTYTITKANSSCVNTQVLSVQTNPLPTVFAIVTPTVVCALTPATLAIGGALTYTWTSPGPPTYTFTGASPIVSPIAPSVYSVTASDGTCISTTTVFLNANPNPTITATASTPSLCEGQTVNLNASGGINYTWTATGGGIFNGASIADTPTTATAYNVTGDNSFGCTSGASQVVLVYAKPNLTVTSNKALICSGGAATLTALGANTYSWDANANNVLTQAAVVNPIALTSSAVMYTVEGTNSNTGCKNTQTVLVNVFVPTLTINGSTNTCSGGLINLTAGNGVLGTYNWHTGSGTPITNQILQMPLTVASVFTLTANSNSVGLICPATQTIALGIYYNPTITAVPARTLICTKESVGITAAGATSYAWNNTMTGPTITVSPTGTTANYTVTGTDDNGCSSTATVQVKISNCSGINELSSLNSEISIYPNPNDGKFTIQTNADLKLSLVNELGQLIRVINLSATNNHEVNISDLAKGIYFVSGQKDGLQIYQKIIVTK
ncbi:T9SS type A sorting domain-containing protein [Aurantibacillus circumpalustris]|uniref:T9SS type A sorting domain-containing protein n=1 Tax=Aurantibacillus circumpalustris TaxID=3036359 RepID=UPI00295BDA5E|nr:T9SS type A sorting domain-containing protein [Aurantibacillus circumpalustris]